MKRPSRRYATLVCFMVGTVVALGARSFAQSAAVPSPWAAQDIGSPAIAGASSYDPATGSFSIDAAGTDIWGTADQFRFVYQPLTGDAVVTARIDAVAFAHAWSKAGVMIRSSLSADAAHGFAFVSAGKGAGFQRRPDIGSSTLSTVASTAVAPHWVRLVRNGSTVTASLSPDGITWTTVGSETIKLGATAYVGIGVTSHNPSQGTTAVVSAVTASVPGALVAAQSNQDIGAPAIAGSAQFSNGTYTVTGAGNDIWGTADQFHYVYQPVSGDVEVSVRVQSIGNTSGWAKAGVMVRQNLTAGSAHAFAGIAAQNGYLFNRRTTPGGSTTLTPESGAPPGWVRLRRVADLVTAYRSTDGVTWTVIGTDSFPMTAPLYVGIAVTSRNASASTTAVLTNYTVTDLQQAANRAPTATLTAPAGGATYTAPATINLTASASDLDGNLSRVDFYNGAALLASDSTAPYSMTWSNVAAGTYSLKATAVDTAGATGSSAIATVTVTAANQPPTATLTAPANGATATAPATLTLTATAADANGTVARVEFYNGGTLLASDTTAPYSWTWGSVGAGTYSVRAVAVDNQGATGTSATSTVTVTAAGNQIPTATLTSPANGASFTAPASVSLTASASDPDGTVARVDFYNGTTLLGSDTTAPYAFTWGSVAAGSYALRATAVDNAGASGSSATATITVSGATNGLVGAYGLNEGTGTTVTDNSGNGRTGTIAGGSWVAGRFGQALSLNGTSSDVTFPDVDLTGSFTVMGWMQTRSLYTNTCGSFVMKAFDYGFEICNGNLLARIGSGTNWNTYAMRTLSSADLNVWKHVAMTFNGTTVRLFLDGVEVASATGTHGSNNNPLLFGRWTPASEYWNGLVDEVRIYSRALSSSEVQTDMNAPVSGGTSNQAPSATLTGPANGAAFTAPATIALTATASDPDGTVARVDFYNGSTLLGSDATAPYAFTWSNVATGTYSLRATAVDNAGASGSSAVATVTVTAANQPPTATLTSPANGATSTAPASIAMTANAADANGTVARVEFYNGSTLLGSDTTAPYTFTWSSVPAGTYTLRATAVDNVGATGSSATATITVTTAATPPPTSVVFQASTDHATVTSYLLEIFANGANPNSATPVASSDLGKPAPATNGDITVNRATLFSALAPGTYILTVSSMGPGGKGRSLSLTFTR
jgi:regulation of enolase protein 1 (concanavalin A-like superfamily)